MHTHLHTLPHLHMGIFACSLHAGKHSDATSAKFLHCWPVISPWQSSPWRWDLATDTVGSIKSLLSFCWGQIEPIRKHQWFYVLLWAITCSFSCCPHPTSWFTLPSSLSGWGWCVCPTWSNIPHAHRGWCDTLGLGWIVHCTCVPLSLVVTFWLPSSEWELSPKMPEQTQLQPRRSGPSQRDIPHQIPLENSILKTPVLKNNGSPGLSCWFRQ